MGIIISCESLNRRSEECVYLEDGSSRRVCTEENVYITTETPMPETPMPETPMPEEPVPVSIDVGFTMHKARDAEQLVSGWANVSVNANGSVPLDWQDDIILPETLEKAAINFMLDYRSSGVMHEGSAVGTVVESIVFTKDKQEALGIPEGILPIGWFITVKVHDAAVFAKVKDGTYKMFSIQGTCRRIKQ